MEMNFTDIKPLIPEIEAMPKEISIIPALSPIYDERDSRTVAILNTVAEFCGKEFTEVPPNPDGEDNPNYDPGNPDDPTNPPKEGGDIMPLDDEPDEGEEENPEYTPDPDEPDAHPYPEGTGEDPNPDLDDLRDKYKEALAKNAEEKQSYWAVLWQVIRLISTMACWTESFDDTFIIQHRKQTYEAKQVNGCCKSCCNCDEDQIVIPLEYAPVENCDEDAPDTLTKPFIRGIISVVVKGKREEVVIDQEYLNEHYDPYTQKLYIMRDDFPVLYTSGCGSCCLCERELTINLFYNAGYCGIPHAILPLICQLMGKIEDAKVPLSDCTAAITQVSGLLKSAKTGNIQYTWSDNDNKLANTQNLFAEIYNVASLAELFGLSRCEVVNKVDAGDVI